MRSLVVKLTLAFLIVSVLGILLVTGLLTWQTRRQFDNLVTELYQQDLEALRDELVDFYVEQSSWDEVESVFFRGQPFGQPPEETLVEGGPPEGFPARRLPATLVDSDRKVIIGDRRYSIGDTVPENLVTQGLALEVNGENVGWVILTPFGGVAGDFPDSPESNFLVNLNQVTVWSVIISAGAALLLGIWLARTISHPVSELTVATTRLARGELGTQVVVRSMDEIGQLGISFNQMSADLARSNQLRRQMTADIAHDLRTPLSVIQGYTEALDEGKLPGDAEIYGAMHKQVKHLNRLVEDLRTLSLADSGQLSLYPFEVAPRDLLEHSLLAYAPKAEQKGVNLNLDLATGLPNIIVDLDRMLQVLGNLISNALRHTPIGGEITLSAKSENQYLLLQVQDTGKGIAPEDLPHVFDRFYRGDKSRTESGESGLGLAIARSIVEAHHGLIQATSTVDKGTTFTISLPLNPGT